MIRAGFKIFMHLVHRCLDIAFPPTCIQCAGAPCNVQSGPEVPRFICSECQDGFYWINDPACLRCGVPFWGHVDDAHTCPTCMALQPAFDRGCSVFLHRGVGRTLVHALKYKKARYLQHDLLQLLQTLPHSKRLARFVENAVLVPVPLHASKLRERGFNQSQLIAEQWSKAFPTGGVACLLERHRLTVSQTDLRRSERLKNVSGAFRLRQHKGHPVPLCPKTRYVLVDDVFTTGATLHACARVLKKRGAQRVDCLTLTHG